MPSTTTWFAIAAMLAALAAAPPADAQATPAKVAALEWLSGTWVQEKDGERVVESWVGPGNGLMAAVNLTTYPGGRKTFEFLRIAETPTGYSYFASPGGRVPVEFALKESGERRVVFENPQHEFPRRIAYWREGESLIARIEGSLHGAERSEQWRFERK
jgi:hypothetical protein